MLMILDHGMLKRFTGGPGQRVEGRRLSTDEHVTFTWTARYLLA